jgi:hypothetical protein
MDVSLRKTGRASSGLMIASKVGKCADEQRQYLSHDHRRIFTTANPELMIVPMLRWPVYLKVRFGATVSLADIASRHYRTNHKCSSRMRICRQRPLSITAGDKPVAPT